MKPLTQSELNTIEIKTSPNGFTVWMTGINKEGKLIRRWVVDGSRVKHDGKISLSTNQNLEFTTVLNANNDEITIFKNT